MCVAYRLSGCEVQLAVLCVWWPAVSAGVCGQSAVWDWTLSRGHSEPRTLLQQSKHTGHCTHTHTACRHTRPVRTRAERERERNEQRMELDSGGGRKILNGCINFSVESTHTYCMLWPLFLSVASLCSWWKEIKMKTCRESSEVCKKQTCTLY